MKIIENIKKKIVLKYLKEQTIKYDRYRIVRVDDSFYIEVFSFNRWIPLYEDLHELRVTFYKNRREAEIVIKKYAAKRLEIRSKHRRFIVKEYSFVGKALNSIISNKIKWDII